MKIGEGAHGCHLTYCTNIHAGERWGEVRENLGHHVVGVRDAIGRDEPFGIGLRLSGIAADELAGGDSLTEFTDFLERERMYVFTINGFPYGPFHGTRVKDEVYLPDWSDPERLRYTNLLADLLARLVPSNLEGSVSTVPGAFRARAVPERVDAIVENLLSHVAHLVALRERTGQMISLAIEPEPCCMLETIAEAADFFAGRIFNERAEKRLGGLTGLTRSEAADALRRHLGVCLDTCHAAVEFEDPGECVAVLEREGVRVPKIQVSAGLRLQRATPARAERLRAFADDVYLHQVVACRHGELSRWADLPEAFDTLEDDASPEWRVHFHVPLFLGDLGDGLATTRDFTAELLGIQRKRGIAPHLEVETYTWDVLPERHRDLPLADAVAREIEWTRQVLVG